MFSGKKEVLIMNAKRTPIGKRNGMLKDLDACDLGAALIKDILSNYTCRSQWILPDEVIIGNMIQSRAKEDGSGRPRANPAQEAVIKSGYTYLSAWTVGRACSSGLQSIVLADRAIRSGDCGVVLAGGMESMSRFSRNFIKEVLTDPLAGYTTLEAGEWCARYGGYSRIKQDAWAAQSYRRAQIAQAKNMFWDQIFPVLGCRLDEEPARFSDSDIQKAEPMVEGGTVTSANASKNADGAAMCLLMSKERLLSYNQAIKSDLKPLAKILGSAHVQTSYDDTRYFTIMPARAVKNAVYNSGLRLSDIELFEINAPFSSVICHAINDLNIDASLVNVFGDSISFGHPVGASGAILVVKAVHIARQLGKRYAVVSLCHALGGATAMVIEVLPK